jgi:serine/threonine protein phosphatase 1
LKRLPLFARSGDYFFCHAGVRPGVALRRQTRNDLLWIREDFLTDESEHGAVIVHGHSIETEVTIRSNRIGIDTGAYRTGVLTALYLEGEQREIIAAKAA